MKSLMLTSKSSMRNSRSIGGVAVCTALLLLSSAVTSLAAPPWSAPVILSQPAPNAEAPSVAINDSGAMAAVWAQEQGVTYNVQGAVNLNGTWTQGVNLSPAGPSGMRPDVVIDNTGVVTAVWTNGTAIQAAELP